MLSLDLAVLAKGNPADSLIIAFRGDSFDDGEAAAFCVDGFLAGDAVSGVTDWVVGAEGGPAAGEEAAPRVRAAVEATDSLGRAAALPGGGNAAAGAGAEGRAAAFFGEGRRAVKEAGPDKCLLRGGPVLREARSETWNSCLQMCSL